MPSTWYQGVLTWAPCSHERVRGSVYKTEQENVTKLVIELREIAVKRSR